MTKISSVNMYYLQICCCIMLLNKTYCNNELVPYGYRCSSLDIFAGKNNTNTVVKFIHCCPKVHVILYAEVSGGQVWYFQDYDIKPS